jgi:quercetin dioxygenase-like cupin family protein
MIWFSNDVNEQIQIEKFFSLFEIHYDNGFNFLGESHNFWECLYVLDGKVCVSGDERVYNLTKGEII